MSDAKNAFEYLWLWDQGTAWSTKTSQEKN